VIALPLGVLERALLIGFAASFTLWLGLSLYTIGSRLLHDRRSLRLSWDLPRTLQAATSQRGSERWRRIAALTVLAQVRAPEAHELLERALFGTDPEVTRAAVVMLRRLGDRRAARILLVALSARAYSPSRIATELEQFVTPLDDLLHALLSATQPHARYWAVSLLARYHDAPFVAEIAALAEDADASVRKVVLLTLAEVRPAAVAPIAERRLGDPVAYVRSAAVHALARAAADSPVPVRRALAAQIAPLLADRDWGVRLAAKEALVALGSEAWGAVFAQLDVPDAFARNGAAEVLQNSGLLDRLIDDIARGRAPPAELLLVLERALREGGAAMIDAASARSDVALRPTVERLLGRLRIAGARRSA
jgi:HEAT repeat protein